MLDLQELGLQRPSEKELGKHMPYSFAPPFNPNSATVLHKPNQKPEGKGVR